MPDAAATGSGAPDDAASRALRAQLLATEHWSLLASRGTTQSEVPTRISMFLTLVSSAFGGFSMWRGGRRFFSFWKQYRPLHTSP